MTVAEEKCLVDGHGIGDFTDQLGILVGLQGADKIRKFVEPVAAGNRQQPVFDEINFFRRQNQTRFLLQFIADYLKQNVINRILAA